MKNKIKNGLIRVFFTLIKKWNKPLPTHNNCYLIVSTTGLGDTLWATPAIRALKDKDAKIYLLCTKFSKEVLKSNPHIENVFILQNPYALVKKLKKLKIDTVYIFHSSQRLTLPVCALIGASKIIGYEKSNKGLDFLLTDAIKKERLHEIDQRLNLIGLHPAKNRSMEFYIAPNTLDPLLNFNIDPNKPLLLIHPGAKDVYKCWPKKYFIEVANALVEKASAQIIVSCGKQEEKLGNEVSKKITNSICLPSNLPLHSFAKALTKADVVITNDTGPMHLAAALNIPVIAPFAPTNSSICGPVSNGIAIAIDKPKTCTPCLKRKCKDSFCLLQISPNMVITKALKILKLCII